MFAAAWHAGAVASVDAPRDAVVARAWLDDPGSTLTPQQALERAWTPFAGVVARGFTGSTTWVRLALDPRAAGPGDTPADDRLVLRVQPGSLDELAVFRVDRPGEPPIVVGDTHERTGHEMRSINHTVVIRDAVAPFELLLRIRTQGNHSLFVQALRWEDAQQAEFRLQTTIVAFIVFMLMVIAWAATVWLAYRDALLRVFIVHQTSTLVLSLALLGVLRLWASDWIPAAAIDMFTSVMIPVTVGLGIWFHASLLRDFGARAPELAMLRVLAIALALVLALVLIGYKRTGLQFAHASNVVITVLTLVAAWRTGSGPSGVLPKSYTAYLVGVYAVMAVVIIPPSLRVLGVLPAGPWTYSSFITYGVISSALLGSLVKLRARRIDMLRREAARTLERTERQVALQRARISEQSDLMTMLTHELKTPLSVVSLALGESGQQPRIRERARRAVQSMRDVIDRCAQSARLVDESDGAEGAGPHAPLDPAEVLREAVRRQIQTDRIDLRLPADPAICRADRQLLLVIVGNLLENALKYAAVDARVQLSVDGAPAGDRAGVIIAVTNPVGPAGRPDSARLFGKYQRGARAQHQAGSGLGLYLSKQLAHRLDGDLTLRDGEDVRFELWLPT